ncbi:MAG: S41 family peptidase [Pseudohongiellaceae bacterium]
MSLASLTDISRILSALLGLGSSLFAQIVSAQVAENEIIASDSLDYYLIQAFEAPRAEQRLALNHIGIQVLAADAGFIVTAALEGYPAHQSGIMRGDKIISVNGEPYHPVYSFNSNRSESGRFLPLKREHQLEFERQGTLASVNIVPVFENLYDSYRSATVTSAQAFPLGNKLIGYIRFWGLSRSTSDLFTLKQVMGSFTDSDGMIVDLRNSYGYLSSFHLDLFIRDGRGKFESSDPSNRHTALGRSLPLNSTRPFTKPIVVLVNSETRAGAELFAYGLSKLGRITTLGQNSAGEIGSYLFDDTNSGESVLRYVPAEKMLIDGKLFESTGVIPKEPTAFPFTQSSRSDPQFESAVNILLGII